MYEVKTLGSGSELERVLRIIEEPMEREKRRVKERREEG